MEPSALGWATSGRRLWRATQDPGIMMGQLGSGLKAVEAYLRLERAASTASA